MRTNRYIVYWYDVGQQKSSKVLHKKRLIIIVME